MKKLDLAGQRFGKLTAIEQVKTSGRGMHWRCICECGNEIITQATSLNTGHVKSCGCYVHEFRRLPGTQTAMNRLYTSYERNAALKGRSFTLTRDQFEILVKSSCAYCGIEPTNQFFPNHYNQDTSRVLIYNGIDRKDNAVGYTVENCVPCCTTCNLAKRNMTVDEFRNWIRRVNVHLSSGVEEKTPAFIIDELFTTLMKLWIAQENIMKSAPESREALESAKKAQELNARRNKLMRSLDIILGFASATLTEKTYG